MIQKMSIGFSTCPNDTFIFHALIHDIIKCENILLFPELKDVETLNQDAVSGKYDISKLSFAALGHLLDQYALLRSGAALGRGCGPLIVAKPGIQIKADGSQVFAIPGLWTTAFLLLSLFLQKQPQVRIMPFDQIMPCIQRGEAEMGLIIHEGRFTFEQYGLEKIIDLGEWWEQTTSLPIPLGGIAIHRRIDSSTALRIEHAIAESVQYALQHPDAAMPYILKHAQELDPQVIQQHISLYVNDFTINLGKEGEQAVDALMAMAGQKGLLPALGKPLFIN